MSEEKQSISSEEVGSVEDVLGKSDPILRPVSEPDGIPGPDPEPEEKIREIRKRLSEENRNK